jgi:hypothetical protein
LLQDQTFFAPFSFEHSWTMSPEDYLRLNAVDLPRTPRARLRLVVVGLVGGLMLASPYSAGMGVVVIAMVVFLLSTPRMSRSVLRRKFAETAYLQGPVRYGVSGRGFWMAAGEVGAESTWAGLAAWQEREGWLVLSGSGMPPVYLPLADLRAAELYPAVVSLARANGREIDLRAARSRSHEAV